MSHAGAAVLHPRDGPHHGEGVRDGLLPHADRRAQPPGLQLPAKPARHRRLQVSPSADVSMLTVYARLASEEL